MRRSGLFAKLCALFAVGVAPCPALADSDAWHKAATMVTAARTKTYRIDLVRHGPAPLAFRVLSSPAFARFDAESGTFTFQPSVDQLGYHKAELEVFDGESTFTYTLMVTVVRNRAPMVTYEDPLLVANRSSQRQLPLVADEESDPLTVVEQRLPRGARLTETGSGLALDWAPTDADIGEHALTLVVSDGLETTRLERKLHVVPEWHVADWSTHLVPSLGTTGFLSHSGDAFGGAAFEWTLFARRTPARDGLACRLETYDGDCHASLFRLYVNFELLDAPRVDEAALFAYAFGYSGSFETYTERRALVPFYALEIGGLWQDGTGHRFAVRPALGIHLWADHRVWLDLSVGERIVPAELSRLSGPSATLSAMLIPW
jgi:hypothetical protein